LPACDALVIARSSTALLDNVVLRAELEQLWRKLIARIADEPARAAEASPTPELLNAVEAPGTMRDHV